jgi:hypothetical protein
MTLPGSFSVAASGAATYIVPIAMPPGTAGMAPSLSLEYSSQGGNGIIGVGWSLTGLPSIGRCPQTFAQDGVRGGVNYDANDRFCFEGQRLIAISGSYGADGTEYRTEVESFTRVISHGTAGTGPGWFEVHTKSGQVMEFGHTADSQILAVGKATARNWAANKVSDTKGNYFTVTYTNDATNGQAYPIEVDYTGNAAASLAPYNKVQFIYASRPDANIAYQAGSLINTTVRLTDVKTYAGSSLVADYTLTYAQGADTGRSHLTSIALCVDSGVTCLPATNLSWTDDSPGTFTTASNLSLPNSNGWTPYLGDFNGDGKTDILWCNANSAWGNSCTNPSVFWFSNGDGTFTTASTLAPPGNGWLPFLGDFNGDGKTDIMWCNANSANGNSCTNPAVFWFSKGDGTFTTASTIAPPGNFWTPYLGDFNGDGKTDILWCNANSANGNSCTNPAVFWFSNGDGTFTTASTIAPPGNLWIPYLGDFNGDGKTDVLWCNANYAWKNSCTNPAVFWLSNGDGTFTTASTLSLPGNGWTPYLGDFNGDGKTDILWCNASFANGNSCTNPAVFWLSKGDGTFTTASSVAPPGDLWTPYLVDFNGDGRTDILWCNANSANGNSCTNPAVFWRSNGDGTFTTDSMVAPPGSLWLPYPGDFNGDGRTDILWCNANFAWANSCTPPGVVWLSNGPQQNAATSDLLAKVVTGIGSTTSINYQSLTNSSVYTKDANAVFPVQDLQPPMQVVSRVDIPNGIGGVYSTAYSYIGEKVDLSGYGPLGFRQMTAKDLQTGIAQTTNYRQDFPYIGLTASMAKVLGTQTLNQTTNGYQFSNVSGAATVGAGKAPYKASMSQSVAQGVDLDGTALPSSTSTYQYDAYNNTTQVSVATSDGYSKTTNNTYTNDTANWFLGRLTASTVTSQAPQQLGQYCALPWGGTISNGQSVTAYSAAHPTGAQACSAIAETRTCTNGTLSGSNTQQACTLLACTLPWGGSIASGQSVTAYSAASPAVGQACSALAQTRACTNGALSGGNAQQSCTPLSCTLPWGGSIGDGQSVTAYSATSPPAGQACSTISQTRTCSLGTLSGSYTQQSCSAVCALPWSGTINQGQSVTAYSSPSVGVGQLCSSVAQTRTCGASGTLSGSYTNQGCIQPTSVTISSSTNNLNLWSYLVANGFASAGTPGFWVVTIGSGAVIGSASTATPAFDTGTFPAGSTLQITNNGRIEGAGGSGGRGAAVTSTCAVSSASTPGGGGGPALQARLALTMTNNGGVWGGGGGGGGGIAKGLSSFGGGVSPVGGGGGGGGAGIVAGAGGSSGSGFGSVNGAAGTSTAGGAGGPGGNDAGAAIGGTGGAGGGPGLAGNAATGGTGSCTTTVNSGGGATGSATIGNSFITWSVVGDRRGALN